MPQQPPKCLTPQSLGSLLKRAVESRSAGPGSLVGVVQQLLDDPAFSRPKFHTLYAGEGLKAAARLLAIMTALDLDIVVIDNSRSRPVIADIDLQLHPDFARKTSVRLQAAGDSSLVGIDSEKVATIRSELNNLLDQVEATSTQGPHRQTDKL